MVRLHKYIEELVNENYSSEQKEEVIKLLDSTPNFGIRNYGTLLVGLGENIENVSMAEIKSFYNYPSWKANEVDKLIANLVLNISKFNKDARKEYLEALRMRRDNCPIKYLSNEVVKIMKKEIV